MLSKISSSSRQSLDLSLLKTHHLHRCPVLEEVALDNKEELRTCRPSLPVHLQRSLRNSTYPCTTLECALLGIIDYAVCITLTKGVILCPTKKTIDAAGVAALFFSKVFRRFGLYDKIISNRGPQFTSVFAKELGRLLGYELTLSTAYHPQTDGEMERVNQEPKTYLRIFCRSNSASWAQHITLAEFTHNHCPHSVTNQSPFYLMMGYEPHALPTIISETLLPAVQNRLTVTHKIVPMFCTFDCSLNNSGGQTPINRVLVYQWKHLLRAKRW